MCLSVLLFVDNNIRKETFKATSASSINLVIKQILPGLKYLRLLLLFQNELDPFLTDFVMYQPYYYSS